MKVSIITACHNSKIYLKDCIRSVVKQDYDNYEHVILDDCSNDRTYAKILEWSGKNTKIRPFKSDSRLHCGGAYNFLSKQVTGDIVCVLDSDDALASGAIKKIVKIYEQNPEVGYVWTQFWYCNAFLKKIKLGFSKPPGNKSLLESGHCFSHWRTYRSSVNVHGDIFKIGLKAAVDKYMGYRLEELGIGGFANVALYKYRQRFGGLSYTGKKAWKKMKIEFSNKRREKSIDVFPVKTIDISDL